MTSPEIEPELVQRFLIQHLGFSNKVTTEHRFAALAIKYTLW